MSERKPNTIAFREQVSETNNERQMREAFSDSVEKILKEEDRFRKQGGVKVGLEIEATLVHPNVTEATEFQRDIIVGRNSTFADVELGAPQIEWRTDPIDILQNGLDPLAKQLKDRSSKLIQDAHAQNLKILFSGSSPLTLVNQTKRTHKEKYQQVPDFHNRFRSFDADTKIGLSENIDVGDAAVVSLLNSIQCNVEATSFDDAVDKLNRSLSIGPMAVSMSANARFLAQKDLGIADVRMPAWEISHEVRTKKEIASGLDSRLGLPGKYYKDMKDYFSRIATHPFILNNPENALQVGIGLYWKDTRIKVIGNSLVVEFRPVSTQPSDEENLSVMMFYIGRLLWSVNTQEPLLPIEVIRLNRAQAMVNALDGKLLTNSSGKVEALPAKVACSLEINRAAEALEQIGVNATVLDILKHRVEGLGTPSERAEKYFKKNTYPNEQTYKIIKCMEMLGAVR